MTEIHEVYGEAAAFSEHRVGDHITYRRIEDNLTRTTQTGEILWCCAPQTLANGREVGVTYVVAPDVETGFIDIVSPGEVVIQS